MKNHSKALITVCTALMLLAAIGPAAIAKGDTRDTRITRITESPGGPDQNNWRILPIRWQQQYEAGIIGGEGEQHPHAMTRSESEPDIIYLSHDVGQIWRSDDDGHSWRRLRCQGMHVRQGQSIAVDPVDSQTVIAAVSNAWDWMLKDYAGLYLSSDGGENWKQVLKAAVPHQRSNQRAIAYDPASVTDKGAQRWYAAIFGDKLYGSTDAGTSWMPISRIAQYGVIHQIQTHPSDGKSLYMATEKGLMASSDMGTSFKTLGDLPEGEVSSVFVHPDDGRSIFAVLKGRGLYLSEDSGRSFYLIKDFPALYLFANDKFPDNLYLTGKNRLATYSRDAGHTWNSIHVTPPLGHPAPQWKSALAGDSTGVCPRPDDPKRSLAYSRAAMWRCDKGDGKFVDSSTLFTGFAWGWFDGGITFDRYDPEHFWMFCFDIGMVETRNNGRWFSRHGPPRQWFNTGKISWTGMYTGSQQPINNSGVLVGAVGRYFNTKLVRSENAGHTWQIVDDQQENNFFVSFHPDKPQIVYAGNRISRDGGKTFEIVEYLDQYNASIMAMCQSRPDTIYAVGRPRKVILRSDDTGISWRVYTQADWHLARHDTKPTFTADPSDPDRIYSIDALGDLAVFDGEKWESFDVLRLTNSPEAAPNFVSRIAVDPRHPEIIYAKTYLPGCPFIFRSTDRGATWLDITGNQPMIGDGGLIVSPYTGEVFTGGACGTRLLPPPYDSPKALYHTLPDNWLDNNKSKDYFRK